MPYLTAGSLAQYQMTQGHLALMNDIFVGKKPIRFNKHQNRLFLDLDWENDDIQVDEFIVAEVYAILNPDTYTDVYNDMFLKKYTTALFKRQWGMNLIKFEGVQLPGGVTLNGARILDEAKEEINALHEEMRLTYELPVDFMVGPG